MGKILFFAALLLSALFFSQQDYRATITVDTSYAVQDSVDVKEFQKAFREELGFAREKCKKDSLRANEEAKYNLTYSLALPTPAIDSDIFLAEREFVKILREKNIGFGGYIVGNCFGIPDNCFQWEMNRIIEKKYGKSFIENLKTEAAKKFIINNPDRIFEFEECDVESRYFSAKTYQEMTSKTETDYLKNFEYPEDFEFRKSNSRVSFADANFILDKRGRVSKVQIELTLQEKKNYIYSSYLIESLKEFIQKSKWKSATYQGVPVTSKMNVLIFYK